MGFADVGAMWRSSYDMPPDDFAKELDRLWEQVRPLYVSLHAYVRWKLAEKYGKDVVREDEPIPAHLLGNMWAQEWNNIYPLLAPPNADSGPDVGAALARKKCGRQGHGPLRGGVFHFARLRAAAGDFLGAVALHQAARPRSGLPRQRVGHRLQGRLADQSLPRARLPRISRPSITSWATISTSARTTSLPPLFQNGANDGFHEAIGDTIALSVTPEYLKQIGLIDTVPPPSADIGLLLDRALDKVAFLPFGLLIDQWRWKVFSGEIKPADYNKSWWELRRKYQGIAPPVARSEADFDPGAKYHVAANVPYTRYFLAYILQFQFHRALCKEAGYTGPLHRCSIYGNKAAGAKFAKMLAMGAEPPVAGRARGADRPAADGCDRHTRLFCAAKEVAR